MTIFFNHFRDHQNVNFFDSFYKVAIFTGKPILCQLSPPSILLALWCKTEKNHNAWNQWCICISQKPLYRTNAISLSIFPRSTCNLLKCINPLLKLGKKWIENFRYKTQIWPDFEGVLWLNCGPKWKTAHLCFFWEFTYLYKTAGWSLITRLAEPHEPFEKD